MTHTPICTCNVNVAQRDETDPAAWPPVVFRVNHCPLHRAAPELLEACQAVVKSAVDDDGCTWCDRSSQWGHEEWCPIPSAITAIAKAGGVGECSECGGTGTVIVTSSPGLPEHGTIEQESCPKCNGGEQ